MIEKISCMPFIGVVRAVDLYVVFRYLLPIIIVTTFLAG
jgi:hypothetical protein